MDGRILLLFYILHLIIFYFFLIFPLGDEVTKKCDRNWGCRRFYNRINLGHDLEYSVDSADVQWRDFRKSLLLLATVACGHCLLSYFIDTYSPQKYVALCRQTFYVVFGTIFICIQHGFHSLIVIFLCLLGYYISKFRSHQSHPYLIWTFTISVLFLKESYRLQQYPAFQFLVYFFDTRFGGGMYSWRLPANFMVLRMVSFNMDSYWAHHQHRKSSNDVSIDSTAITTTNDDDSHPDSAYDSLLSYSAYMLYAPLYIAGPVTTFNAFLSYSKRRQTTENVAIYAIRWLGCLLLMEYFTHRFPFFAVISSGLVQHLTIAETAVLFYLTLKIMWLKFLLIWRFFRLWALADGVFVPENMIRCMSNNCSLEQFWKGWHSSFNKWLVRYLYKPLGGRDCRYVSVWLIFLFVALWHDLEPKLLAWGVLNAFFYVVEVLCRRVVKQYKPSAFLNALCVLGSAVYIGVLILVNLIGYSGAAGQSQLRVLFMRLTSTEGLTVLLVSGYFLVLGIFFMDYLKQMGCTASKDS
mmetsp:Transcript_24045/g.34443  ORF Transcript_24045/g.34443 Transcript_24045/m.34443 type:complete len:523 (+) Transcript_24045:2-1570(+)